MRSLEMDSISMNHYERQLYTVFKTFDVDNEEALDRSAVLELCNALQLEERGATLVDTLFERRDDRVTFGQFRNGLLTVLGGGDTAAAAPPPISDVAPLSTLTQQTPHSDDDSSGREVAPKFVFGSKKYGRRSRPQRSSSADEPPSPRAASDSRLDSDVKREKHRMRCKRSTSLMENHKGNSVSLIEDEVTTKDLDHGRRIDCEEALALCHGLHMDGIDHGLVEGIFENSPPDGTTVGEFFDRLNLTLSTSMETACDGGASTSRDDGENGFEDERNGAFESEHVIEAWERAGVQQARRLLVELGFTAVTLRATDLERALNEELCALSTPLEEPRDARVLLLLATLALNKLREKHARHLIKIAVAERDKLRIDLVEANRRAQILAQDIDESHAHIDAELKARLRLLEARHAETSRAASAEWAAEREKAAVARFHLEEELARRADLESKLRTDINTLREQNEELLLRVAALDECATEAEREHARLENELKNMADHSGDTNSHEQATTDDLATRLEELRLENKVLRDRNDELCAELEASMRHGGPLMGAGASGGASWREEAAEATRDRCERRTRGIDTMDFVEPTLLFAEDRIEECDSSLTSIDQKVFGHIEIVRRLQSIFENIQKNPPATNAGCVSCLTLEGIVAMMQDKVRELSNSVILVDQSGLKTNLPCEASVQTEPRSDKDIEKLREERVHAERRHEEEKQKLTNLVRELETSLEQMKSEYDKCEEYWSNKLEEEREIYNEEQRLSDERLTDLIGKISEYERQFAPGGGALPAIDERRSLEAQFNDLEDEFTQYKRAKEGELRVKAEEIARLADKIEILERRAAANERRSPGSDASSPIEYLWNQSTIQTPQRGEKRVRDYQNPAFVRPASDGENAMRPASDGEREGAPLNPIRRPASVRRSASAGALPAPRVAITCADREERVRNQAHDNARERCECGAWRSCSALAARCRQLAACVAALRGAAAREAAGLRARLAAAEGALARLHARLAAADTLVKDLYLENCQLAHRRLL